MDELRLEYEEKLELIKGLEEDLKKTKKYKVWSFKQQEKQDDHVRWLELRIDNARNELREIRNQLK